MKRVSKAEATRVWQAMHEAIMGDLKRFYDKPHAYVAHLQALYAEAQEATGWTPEEAQHLLVFTPKMPLGEAVVWYNRACEANPSVTPAQKTHYALCQSIRLLDATGWSVNQVLTEKARLEVERFALDMTTTVQGPTYTPTWTPNTLAEA